MAGFKQGAIELRKKTVVDPSTGELMTVYRNQEDKIVLKTQTGQEIIASESFVTAISADLQFQIDNLSGDFLGLTDTPDSYSGANTFLVAVSGNKLYFRDPATIITDTSGLQTQVNTISGDLDLIVTNTSGITGGLTQLDDRYLNVGEGGFITTSEVQGISSNLQGQISGLRTDVNTISGSFVKSDGTTTAGRINLSVAPSYLTTQNDYALKVTSVVPTSASNGIFAFNDGTSNKFSIHNITNTHQISSLGGSISLRHGSDIGISMDNNKNIIIGASTFTGKTLSMYGNTTIRDNLTIGGDLTVNGTTTTVNTENLSVEDNIITLNSNITGAPPIFLESGIKVNRGNQDSYYFIFRESDLTFAIGVSGNGGDNMQAVATRTNLVNNNLVYWDDANKTLKDTGTSLSDFNTLQSNVTSVSGQATTNSTNITNLRTDVVSISGQLLTNISNVFSLQSQVTTISGNVNNLITYTSGITGGLTQLDDRYLNVGEGGFITTSEVQGISSNLQGQISGLRTDVNSISGQVLSNTTNFNTLQTRVNTVSGDLSDLFLYTKEPTGVVNKTDIAISVNTAGADLVATVSPTGSSFIYYIKGQKYTVSSPNIVTITSPITTGYFIYYQSGSLTYSTTPWDLTETCPIAYIFYNSVLDQAFVLDERHGATMDSITHQYLHSTRGTQLVSGCTMSGYTLNTTTNDANAWGMSSGVIADEDLQTTIPTKTDPTVFTAGTQNYIVFYRNGAGGDWYWKYSEVPFSYTGAGYAEYNLDTAGTWSLSPVGNNNWMKYFVFAVPGYNTTERLVVVPAQAVQASKTLADAYLFSSMSLGQSFPFTEIVLLYEVTIECRSAYSAALGEARTVTVTKNVNSSFSILSSSSPSSHNALTGLQGGISNEYFHLSNAEYTSVSTIGTLTTNTSGITGGFTQLDNTFVNVSGDTMTGTLVISGGQAYSALRTLESSATINTDLNLGDVNTVTLSVSGATLANPTNLRGGGSYMWIIKQPSSGSPFTLSYGNVFKFPGAVTPTLTALSGSVDVLSCISDGSLLFCNMVKDFR
jgi:hypothetical protein